MTRRNKAAWGGLLVILLLLTSGALAQPVTVAQAEATQPGVPPAPVPPSGTLGWMFTAGVVANYFMRKLKEWDWVPVIQEGAGKVNVALAAVLALATSLGIHTEFDAAAGSLLITGLTWTGVFHFAGEWVRQLAIQQFTYQSMRVEYVK